MISVEKYPGGNILVINGQKILPDDSGFFRVTHDMINQEDLSMIPAGTSIVVRHPGIVTRDHANEFLVNAIDVQEHGRVSVTATLHRCPCCWKHSFNYEDYFTMVTKRLKTEESSNTGFTFQVLNYKNPDQMVHLLLFDVPIGRFSDIERHVTGTVMQWLKPLHDIRDAADRLPTESVAE